MDPRTDWIIRKYMQVCAGIGRYTQVYARGKSKVTRDVTGDASDLHLTHQVRRRDNPEGRSVDRGATTTRGRKRATSRRGAASTTAVQEVRIGEAAFRPPLNLMRVGTSL